MRDADEDHVPVRASPASPFTIARNPLLLSAGIDIAIDERVSDIHPPLAHP